MALRGFLGYELTEVPPDHSTLSHTRRLIDLESHQGVFTWILRVLAKEGLRQPPADSRRAVTGC